MEDWPQGSDRAGCDFESDHLQAQDVRATSLYNVAEVVVDSQVNHLNLLEKIEHPLADTLRFVDGPVRYDGFEKAPSVRPPLLGEHSGQILHELGYDTDTVKELPSRGVSKTL